MDLVTLLILILFVAWVLGGWVVPVGGSAIHLLIVIVLVLVVVKLLRGQKVV